MNSSVVKSLLSVFVVVFLSGCVAAGQRVTDIAPEKISAGKNIGVMWLSSCSYITGCKDSDEASNQAEFIPDGANGLLILGAVLSAHEEIRQALTSVTADSTVEQKFLQPAATALSAIGLTPTQRKSFSYRGGMEQVGRHKLLQLKKTLKELHPEHARLYTGFGFEYTMNLSAIADEMDADMLAVLEVQQFGVRRDFGPFGVPLGNPYALSLVRLYMTDVATGEILFNDFGVAEAELEEGWREPDDWTKVKTATESALELAIERVMSEFTKSLAVSS